MLSSLPSTGGGGGALQIMEGNLGERDGRRKLMEGHLRHGSYLRFLLWAGAAVLAQRPRG